MPTLDENLKIASESMQAAQVVKPDRSELDSIKKFCSEEVQMRTKNAEIAAELKALRVLQKASKATLLNELKSSNIECLALSKDDAKRFDTACAAEGLEAVPHFIRLLKTNKDSTITSDIIQEALETLSSDDLRESSGENKQETIKEAILKNIRRTIRSFTESVKLMTSLPRGTDIYEVPEASASIGETIYALWRTEQIIKRKLAEKKTDPEVTKRQNELKEIIEGFFVRTGLTAQRIIVEGKPYKLMRRVSVRKPKVGIGKLSEMLDEVIRSIDPASFKPVDIIRGLQIQLSSLPPETKTSISLATVKVETD
jgi:hypothetical protein